MKRMIPVLTVALLMVVTLFPAMTSAQFGVSMFSNTNYRLMLGYTALFPLADDARFSVHMPPTSILRLPSVVLENDNVVYDDEAVAVSLTSGVSISPYGFRFKYNPDSIYYYRESSWAIRLGVGLTLYELVSSDGKHPMSFYLMGFYSSPIFAMEAWNNDQSISGWIDPWQAARYGLSTRIHYYLFDGLVFGISVFHASDIQFGTSTYARENVTYRNFNQMLGISFQLAP
jgi:hypothetical protein